MMGASIQSGTITAPPSESGICNAGESKVEISMGITDSLG